MPSTDTATSIEESTSISSLTDGETYELSGLEFSTPNVFTSLAFTHNLAVKLPTAAWIEDFRRYVTRGELGASVNPNVRLASEGERNINQLLDKFPEFQSLHSHRPGIAHFLMVHKLQYQRLRSGANIRIPQSSFGVAKQTRLLFLKRFTPMVIQERVSGTPLLEMYDAENDNIRSQWLPFLPKINPILRDLIESDLGEHLNWFIRNFLYDTEGNVLFYVDPKPTCLFAKRGNDRNIQSLKEIFFKQWVSVL